MNSAETGNTIFYPGRGAAIAALRSSRARLLEHDDVAQRLVKAIVAVSWAGRAAAFGRYGCSALADLRPKPTDLHSNIGAAMPGPVTA